MAVSTITTEVLVVGGGTGGTAAAIQAARRGAKTLLVTEFPWLGGMLTAAGVAAPDGNELLAWQTGIWGAFLRELRQRQSGGLDNAWVSFFTYEPKVGAAILADWVKAMPNLHWIAGKVPRGVLRTGDRILGVQFDDLTVQAQITLDGTELGDLLALGEVPYRWGWEEQSAFSEPSAPKSLTDPADPLYAIMQQYPVQSPTWVVLLQDVGTGNTAPPIPPAENYDPSQFEGAWEGYGGERFLTYGKLPDQQFMINWPHRGNDYGVDLGRLVQGEIAWEAWAREAIAHSQNFAHFIQAQLGQRYGLARGAFPDLPEKLGGGAFALMPYYRESRRLVGMTTITEPDILPQPGGWVARLPINHRGEMSAIAIGNYPNDHHYPGYEMPLTPKSMHWGGRWTGTPFTIPYEALIPQMMDGFLVCEKNISVSHIANGATRLQPVVLGIGQAAGMAAALCVERNCEPRHLPVGEIQKALINEPTAPAAVVPIFNVLPGVENWRSQQNYYQSYPEKYSIDGQAKSGLVEDWQITSLPVPEMSIFQGILNIHHKDENWQAQLLLPNGLKLNLVTLHPDVHDFLKKGWNDQPISVRGIENSCAGWIQIFEIIAN